MTRKEASAWKTEFARVYKIAKSERAPRIVLWGPSPRDRKGYSKRKKIERAIRSENPSANILYPEDPTACAIASQYTDNVVQQGLLQARSADLVIALVLSPGACEEVSRYSLDMDIARRLIIIAPESKRESFLGKIMNYLKVYYIRDSEFDTCRKTRDLCRKEVRAWVIAKLFGQDLSYV